MGPSYLFEIKTFEEMIVKLLKLFSFVVINSFGTSRTVKILCHGRGPLFAKFL